MKSTDKKAQSTLTSFFSSTSKKRNHQEMLNGEPDPIQNEFKIIHVYNYINHSAPIIFNQY
jgi:hypothetical protein